MDLNQYETSLKNNVKKIKKSAFILSIIKTEKYLNKKILFLKFLSNIIQHTATTTTTTTTSKKYTNQLKVEEFVDYFSIFI